jgi:hypothetical protein
MFGTTLLLSTKSRKVFHHADPADGEPAVLGPTITAFGKLCRIRW